jgi:hypothetical protein
MEPPLQREERSDYYNLEGQVPVFITPLPTNRVAQLYPRHRVPFSSSPMSCKAAGEVEVEVTLRLTVSRLVCLDVQLTSGAKDQIVLSVRQLGVC